MAYKITDKVLDLVEGLFNEGYTGEASITNKYASGTKQVLEDSFSICLTGFCKETLHIVENTPTGRLHFVGRYYKMECDPSVEGIVNLAWRLYQSYKQAGYPRPVEFEGLFQKYGKLKQKTLIIFEEEQ